MKQETHALAARLAAASEVFPLAQQDDWDAVVHVTAEKGVITVVVTEHMNRAKREYRAVVQLVAETTAAPAAPGVRAPGEDRRVTTTLQGSETKPC